MNSNALYTKRSPYTDRSGADLETLITDLSAQFARQRRNNLQLDLTRGKPATEQLELATALDGILDGNYINVDGIDTRNYGGLRGLREARELGAQLLGVSPDEVTAGGNSSLQLMHAAASFVQTQRWDNTHPTMLCPVPGYDRHFALCDSLGLPMRPIKLDDNGPDMDSVEALVQEDASIGGIWCVPRFSNPSGCTYADAIVERIARLPVLAAHPSFTIFWDNAYSVHSLTADAQPLLNLLDLAQQQGTQDNLFMFASTSKITFAGAGVAFVAGSESTLNGFQNYLAPATIGPDKINQLRTAKFLSGRLMQHMEQHANILRPKFALVEQILSDQLEGLGIAEWTQPKGGYFVSLNTLPGLAKQVVALAAEAGVTLTAAGATYPQGLDPEDRNIRIAPTFPDLQELQTAITVLALAIKIASARLLAQPFNKE